ncbi:amidohydrolase [Pseudomonas citri]|uniref:amidohydrolase n=1 Tax=Pseudomonas citri TaxID=2978349 RepID=UPI0021B5AA81|nr:amidohydrolase family protein [Pseudomonas citri]
MESSTRRTLIFGGPVLTQNQRRETHEAIVLEGDSVVATGALADMRGLAGPSAHKIDVDGACVIPGIIDNHPHFLHLASFDGMCVDLYDARNHDDIRARIRERAAVTPANGWIVTTPVGEPHYFIRRSWRDLPEGRLPNRYELDVAAPDHPVWIQAYAPQVPNISVMNSKALQVLGFGRDLPDVVDNVWIEKDDSGELTGVFRGSVINYYNDSAFWMTRVVSKMPLPPQDIWYHGALAGQIRAANQGVTACYEAHVMDASHIAAYQRVRDEGLLSMRVMSALDVAPTSWDLGLGLTEENVRKNFELAMKLSQTTDPLYRVNGMSLARGGGAWSGFLRIDQTYKDPYGKPTNGRAFVSQSIERNAIEYCLRNNVRLNMVQGGYQDHREFLESLEPFLSQWNVQEREWIMQHNILTDEKTIERYAELNFHLTSSLSFCWGKGDLYQERIGEHVLPDLVPIGKMMASGANVGLGSDWGPVSPFEHMALAETREFSGSGRKHSGPGNTINRQQAFDAWTVNNARLMQWQGIGALMPGYKADIAIVDQNIQACSLEQLAKTQVLRTVMGGNDVFDAGVIPRLDVDELSAERSRPLKRGSTKGHVCGVGCNHAHE